MIAMEPIRIVATDGFTLNPGELLGRVAKELT
jgi:hypothetical protein